MENIRIIGSGEFSGGEYDVVSVIGAGEIQGDITCNSVSIKGSAEFTGSVETSSINIKGSTNISGNVNCKGAIKIYGSANMDADVKSNYFYNWGAFNINGKLESKEVEIKVGDNCQVGSIEAKNILVYHKKDSISLLNIFDNGNPNARLKVKEIVGDNITLENTEVETVKGNVIKVGKNCKINLVQYKTSIDINNNSEVKESINI